MMLSMAPAKVSRLRGKPEQYTHEEAEAIRSALKGYANRNDFKSAAIGEQLGVSQQTANGYLNGTGGFSRPAANDIARLLGFDHAEDLLREHKIGLQRDPTPKLPEREDATRIARRLGVSETAIDRVNVRIGETHHIARWWVDKYIQEQASVDEERLRAAEEKTGKTERRKPRSA